MKTKFGFIQGRMTATPSKRIYNISKKVGERILLCQKNNFDL